MSEATVRVKPLGEQWHTVGTGRYTGVWPEGLTLTSDQWGPRSASFTLKRRPGALFPDLLARTPVEIEVAGVVVWAGRITETPEQEGDSPAIGVQCAGWQYHLDDDVYERIYVHTALGDFKDQRALLGGNLTAFKAKGSVSTDAGIVLQYPNATAVFVNDLVGVTLDLGVSTAKRVVVDWDRVGVSDGNFAVIGRGSDGEDGNASFEDAFVVGTAAASGTSTGTFGTARRYVHLLVLRTSSNITVAQDQGVKIKACRVFADTAYESGGVSALTASTILTDAITRATTQLSTDLTGIGATVLTFPDYAPDGPRTAREQIAAANSPHNWITKIDERKRMIFKARPTSPVVEIGEWAGGDFANASSNSDEDIVTKVIVRGQGPDSQPLSVTRTQTGTIVDRQGGTAAKILDSGFALTTTFAQALGDTYLTAHRTSPLKGQAAVTVNGVRRVQGGETVHPAHLLPLTGELLRLAHRTDPDTGAHSRTGTIAAVTYQHDQATASVDIDNTRSDFEALQARMGLVTPA
jgi:hypothetical protein